MNTNEKILSMVYNKNPEIEYEVSDENIVVILEKQEHKIQRFFRKIGFKIPQYKKLELDEFASFTFLQINGENDVKKIGEIIKDKYGEAAEPLYERLLLFLNHIEVNCNYIYKSERKDT